MKCFKCDKPMLARQLCNTHYMQERRAGRLELKPKPSPSKYIMDRVVVQKNDCWEWQKSTNNGYGRAFVDKKLIPAHVYSYMIFKGQIPAGLQINHICHNRSCVNPIHLYAGTQKDNVRDMDASGRRNQVRGCKNGNSKINKLVAKQIFDAVGYGKNIAKEFKVSISLVYAIKKKQIWKHIYVE